MKKRIYLDNNATTPLDEQALDAMIKELAAPPRNPSSFHSFGQEGKKILSDMRNTIAKYLGVKSHEILFTSTGTEGLNLLIRGAPDKNCIITSPIEHAAVYDTIQDLEKSAEITYLPVDSYGAPKPPDLALALRPHTSLIVLSAANGETGVKLDMEKIGSIAKRADVPLILDGVALLGKEPFTIPEGVTAMAFSAHKFHGPKGAGFVYLKNGFKLSPLITGGGQEKKLRSGTENLPGIVGMATALTAIDEHKTYIALKSLRELFETELMEVIPDLEINGTGPRLPSTSNLYFPGVDGESLLIALDMEGIAASHASACSSGALEPSRVLLGMGYSKERASSSLRFSFSRYNTPEEIKEGARVVAACAKRLRAGAFA